MPARAAPSFHGSRRAAYSPPTHLDSRTCRTSPNGPDRTRIPSHTLPSRSCPCPLAQRTETSRAGDRRKQAPVDHGRKRPRSAGSRDPDRECGRGGALLARARRSIVAPSAMRFARPGSARAQVGVLFWELPDLARQRIQLPRRVDQGADDERTHAPKSLLRKLVGDAAELVDIVAHSRLNARCCSTSPAGPAWPAFSCRWRATACAARSTLRAAR